MFLYNLPFCLIFGAFLSVVYALIQNYLMMPAIHYGLQAVGSTHAELLSSCLTEIIMMALLPIALCFWSTIYIKRARDQFTLYCGKQC